MAAEETEKTIKLTDRQRLFVENYIKLGNKTEAYKQAGYSNKGNYNSICRAANRLLENPNVTAYYRDLISNRRKDSIASVEEVLEFYTSVMRGQVKDAFGLDPSLADRLKAADALAKRYQLFTQKLEIEAVQAVQIVEDLQQ